MAEFSATAASSIKENYHPVSEEEARKSILVEGIPLLDQDLTETSVVQVFSTYGEISKLLLQTHDSGSSQRAVVVFTDEEEAKSSLQANGRDILGATVSVIMASSLGQTGPPYAPGGTASSDGREPGRRFTSAEMVGNWLAQGILLGRRGVAHIREFDKRLGVSSRARAFFAQVKTNVQTVDERHRISSTISQAARTASVRALELDSRLGVSQTATQAAQKVVEMTKDTTEKAMQNPRVANGVEQIKGIVKDMGDWSQQAIENTRQATSPATGAPGAAGAGAEAGATAGTQQPL